jgi:hypothetical protein
MQSVRQVIQTLERRFGLLDASCCDECCGRQVSMVQCHKIGRASCRERVCQYV